LPVHLYGAICDMPEIQRIAAKYSLRIVEDCAESLGATLDGKHTGTFGDIGTFSFFGNKTLTTGEGGAVISNDEKLARRLRIVKGQGQSLTRRYWHEELGFNYRMTNIQAAIGLAQAERVLGILERKHAIAQSYRRLLASLPITFQQPTPGVKSSDWLVSVLLPESTDRDRIMENMGEYGVDTRPVFYCAHHMPMYSRLQSAPIPLAESISRRGISLPSYPGLTHRDMERVATSLQRALAL
jgi:perosamine synthetase